MRQGPGARSDGQKLVSTKLRMGFKVHPVEMFGWDERNAMERQTRCPGARAE